MAIQQYKSAFRSTTNVGAGGPVNIVDAFAYASGVNVGWSGGSVLIDSVSLVPPFSQIWKLLQFSVDAQLLLDIQSGVTIFGKLGKILTGLITGATPTSGYVAHGGPLLPVPYATPIGQVPADQSQIATLWDPASDPLPPSYGNSTANSSGVTLPVTANVALPQPVTINQSEPLGIGIWMAPSLIGATGSGTSYLEVLTGQYCITYETLSIQRS